jgi:hypothetical protein
VAFQDGDGPWTAVTSATNTFQATVTDGSGRYGVAVVTWDGAQAQVRVAQATVAETTSVLNDAAHEPVVVTLEVPTDGSLSPTATLGGVYGTQNVAGQVSFDVPAGTHDLVVTDSPSGYVTPEYHVLRRDVVVTGSAALAALDFPTERLALDPLQSVAFTGGTPVSAWVSFQTRSQLSNAAGHPLAQADNAGELQFRPLPAAQLRSTDRYALTMNQEYGTAQTVVYTASAPSGSYDISAPTLSASLVPGTPNPTVTWTHSTPLTPYAFSGYFSDGQGHEWYPYVTAGRLGGAQTYTVPDLSGVAGWDPAWGPVGNRPVNWAIRASNLPATQAIRLELAPGDVPDGTVTGFRLVQAQ